MNLLFKTLIAMIKLNKKKRKFLFQNKKLRKQNK